METSEAERMLEDLETRIERLRALYEQYFMGIEKLEPQIPRKEVDRRITLLRKEQMRNTAMRFKFQTLVQRFNTMQQYWMRITREIENGTYRRDVIKAAHRFGEKEALTILGKKKAKQYAALLVAQQEKSGKRATIEDTIDLEPSDLIEEEDETPTPPQPAAVARPAAAPLPVVTLPLGDPPASASPEPGSPAITTPPAKGPVRIGGQRWGAPTAPASAVRPAVNEAKRRVAELAAEMKAEREPEASPGFGTLDLDFDDEAGSVRGKGQSPVAARPQPPASAPRAPAPVAAPKPSAPAPAAPAARPAPPQAPGFGVLDIPLDDPFSPAPVARESSSGPSSPASGFRTSAVRPSRPQPAAPAPRAPAPQPAAPVPAPRASAPQAATPAPRAPTPAAPASPGDDLPEQRIRQIYAKYVETKRSTQESTAGVTFEKLAASLRAQATKLKTAHPSKSVDYEVVVKDGKTHLKPILR